MYIYIYSSYIIQIVARSAPGRGHSYIQQSRPRLFQPARFLNPVSVCPDPLFSQKATQNANLYPFIFPLLHLVPPLSSPIISNTHHCPTDSLPTRHSLFNPNHPLQPQPLPLNLLQTPLTTPHRTPRATPTSLTILNPTHPTRKRIHIIPTPMHHAMALITAHLRLRKRGRLVHRFIIGIHRCDL